MALLYPVIIGLYVLAGTDMPAVPSAEAWLAYLAGREASWWGIVGLSAFTDVLWIPVAAGLWITLRDVHRLAAAWGTCLMVLFVVLEMSAGWPAYAVLIQTSQALAAASDDAGRAALVGAASFAVAVLASPLLPFYSVFVPALGKLAFGVAMLKGGPFGRGLAILALLIGVMDVVSAVGRLVWAPLASVVIPASLLSGIWFFWVGMRLNAVAKTQ